MNQTTQMHQISEHLPEYEHSFSPYYSDSPAYIPRRLGLIEFTIAGNKLAGRCRSYLQNHGLPIDYQGKNVVITGSDLFSPKNIRDRAPAAKSASSNGSRAGRAACPASATITAVAPAAVVTSSVSDANGRAHERDLVELDAELHAQLLNRLRLAARAEHDLLDAELRAAPLADQALLAGHDGDLDPRPPGHGHAHAVVRVERLQLVAVLVEEHAAVGQHAVHVEHEEAHAPRPRPYVAP